LDRAICVYCLGEKAASAFKPEHVLPRALAGSGSNWTLTDCVCADCNNRFSKFEAHWTRQAIEGMARNFSGPQSRSGKDRFDRAQPLETDHLYLVRRGDPLVYEAGFAFPNEMHLRPQVLETGTGLLCLAANAEDGQRLDDALAGVRSGRFAITVPNRRRDGRWRVADVKISRAQGVFAVAGWRWTEQPEGIWLRGFPAGALVESDSETKSLTSRLALDHRERLYLRAVNLETAVSFFDGFRRAQADTAGLSMGSAGDFWLVCRLEMDLTRVFRAVLKTGFNLFAYLFGAEAARDAAFAPLRMILLDDAHGPKLALGACAFDDADDADFPKPASLDEHRLQLDQTPEGLLRFRLRLFGHIGYCAHLGVVPSGLALPTRRIIVAYGARGMREVAAWP
jgi:hypothetical protein